jgi:hypothetical protein
MAAVAAAGEPAFDIAAMQAQHKAEMAAMQAEHKADMAALRATFQQAPAAAKNDVSVLEPAKIAQMQSLSDLVKSAVGSGVPPPGQLLLAALHPEVKFGSCLTQLDRTFPNRAQAR